MKTPKYLIRPCDNHIFEIDITNNCYRSYTTCSVTDRFGNRPNAYEHFTFENLTKNYGFTIVDEKDIKIHEES